MGALAIPLYDARAESAGERRLWIGTAFGAIAIAALRALWVGPVLLIDPDLGWHLAIGESILRDGTLPLRDIFSWTAHGEPYQLTQWGGEALLSAAHRLGGAAALHVLCGLTLAGCVLLAFGLVRMLGARPLDAFCVAVIATLPIWATAARPQMFSFLLAGGLLHLLIRAWLRRQPGRLWACAPLLALWANLHGAFTIGAAAVAVGALLLSGRLWLEGRAGSGTAVAAATCALLATLANPYGYAVWVAAWEVAQLWSTRLATIVEWRPTSLASGVGVFFLLFAGVVLLGLARARAGLGPFIAWTACTAFALLMVRNVPVASLAMAALAGRALAKPDAQARPVDPGTIAITAFVACALSAAAVLVARAHDSRLLERRLFPVAAATFLDENRVRGRLLNELEHGGWWIANARHRPVAIDGRLDLYGDVRFFSFLALREMRPGWQQRLDALDPDVVVIRSAAPLRQGLLSTARFALVHEEDGTSVLLRRSPVYAELIRRFERLPDEQPLFDASGRPRFAAL